MDKNILIIGKSAKEYALAQKLSKTNNIGNIYVASGNDAMKDFATCVDIREDDVAGLLDFAMENAVDLTICSSEKAIRANVVGIFQENGQMIFGSTAESAQIAINKSTGKKFLYKLHVPTARFGIFEKPQQAVDYVRNSMLPVVVKTDEHRNSNGTMICSATSIAKSFIEDCFIRNEKRVIIEDFVYGHEFSYYVTTDGYHAIPLSSVGNYKFVLDGDGGLLTPGMGAYIPDYKITRNVEQYIMQEIIFPALDSLDQKGTPYVGILGIDCVLTPDNEVVALEFNPFLQDHDCQGVLSTIEDNLFDIMYACVVGSFADDYEYINTKDEVSVSCVLSAGNKTDKVISGLDNLDEDTLVAHFNTRKNEYLEYLTTGDRTLVVTKNAKTYTFATDALYDEVAQIEFEGKTHRKDLCAVLI